MGAGIAEMEHSTVAPGSAMTSPFGTNPWIAAIVGGLIGTVVGALIGALLLGILRDGLVIKGVNADYLNFYLGLAIIIAMAANTYVGRVRRGAGRV
jgi:simple sugar transport system permease protein